MLDGMNNIKAIEILKVLKLYNEDLPPYSPDEVAEAIEISIKSLENMSDKENSSSIDLKSKIEM